MRCAGIGESLNLPDVNLYLAGSAVQQDQCCWAVGV
jgi:hypothetical protein